MLGDNVTTSLFIYWCTFETNDGYDAASVESVIWCISHKFCNQTDGFRKRTTIGIHRVDGSNRVIKEISIQRLQLKWTPYSFTCCRLRVVKKQHHCFKIRWILSLDHVKCWMSSSIPVAAAAWLRFYIFLRCSSQTTLAFKFNSNYKYTSFL